MSTSNDAKVVIATMLLVGSTACPPSRATGGAVFTPPGCHNDVHLPERERVGAIREPQLAAVTTTSGNMSSAVASLSTAVANLTAL